LLNDVHFDVWPSSGIILPEATKLNLRRRGGLEEGDLLSFGLFAWIWGTKKIF
ncbi:unnamed protein product, partial [marine sediment metagenome]